MNRISTLSVLAAATALIALPASAQTIHIATAGKTPTQLHGEIVKAARKLCVEETTGATFMINAYAACVRLTVSDAVAQVPALAALSPTRVATR
jgi:hypothetical protein